MRRRVLGVAVCLALYALTMPAQDAIPAPPVTAAVEGSVSGHVYLSDTNGPARFTRVMLKPVPSAETVAAQQKKMADAAKIFQGANNNESDAVTQTRMAAMTKMMSSLSDLNISAIAGADGTYTIDSVKPGTYYIHAVVAGYIDPMREVPSDDLENPDPDVQKRVRDKVTTVTVSGAGVVRQDLRLERGAAITGHVNFEDGSPATGWTVSVIPVKKLADGTPAPDSVDDELPNIADALAKITHITDDRGSYRIAGLTPGEYVVRAVLQTQNASGGNGGVISGGALRLVVLSGNVVKRQDATTVTLTAGQEMGDEDLIMPMSKLHAINGRIQAKADAHVVNAGSVSLTEDDAGPSAIFRAQVATVQEDGTFHFDYVADGHYTLKITNASIEQANGNTEDLFFGLQTKGSDTLREFNNDEQKTAVLDSDVNGIVFSLTDKPVKPKTVRKKADDDDQ